MKLVTVYAIRCQGHGFLPGSFATAALAESMIPAAEQSERARYGELDRHGRPRWARVVAMPMVAPDDLKGFEPWSEPLAIIPEASPPGDGKAAASAGDLLVSATGTVS